jgi:hypothetical protein
MVGAGIPCPQQLTKKTQKDFLKILYPRANQHKVLTIRSSVGRVALVSQQKKKKLLFFLTFTISLRAVALRAASF